MRIIDELNRPLLASEMYSTESLAKKCIRKIYAILLEIQSYSNGNYKQTYILALFFASLVFVALIIDLDIVHNKALFALEELFEMNAAIALLFCCLSLYDPRLSKKTPVKSA